MLRLYQVHYPKQQKAKGGGAEKTTFELIDSYQDVINHNRWINAQFLRLGEKTKIVSQHQTNDNLVGPETLLTTAQVHQGVASTFGNSSSEIFVGSIGEMQADTIKFYNVGGEGSQAGGGPAGGFGFSAMASGMIKKVELQQESCAHMSAFCGPAHFSIVIASVTGSMQVWSPRPAKFIQPLAPNFTEIEDNILYVEKEDEFENEVSSEEDTPEEQLGDGAFGRSLI